MFPHPRSSYIPGATHTSFYSMMRSVSCATTTKTYTLSLVHVRPQHPCSPLPTPLALTMQLQPGWMTAFLPPHIPAQNPSVKEISVWQSLGGALVYCRVPGCILGAQRKFGKTPPHCAFLGFVFDYMRLHPGPVPSLTCVEQRMLPRLQESLRG